MCKYYLNYKKNNSLGIFEQFFLYNVKKMNPLIFCTLLSFICSCSVWTEGTRKLAAENAEQENFKASLINLCEIDGSSKNIQTTISIKYSDIPKIKSFLKVERLETFSCYSQPHPKKQFVGRTPWGKRLYFDFTNFYGFANGYPADKISVILSVRNEAIKNCEILLSDYRSKYKNFTVPASCNIAKCQVCEY